MNLIGPEIPYVAPKSEDPSFLGGLKSGWNTFVAVVKVAAAVLGFLVPFLIVAALVGVPLMWWLRRRKRAVTSPAE